jgi:predicted DCC family thiol-disulfide oxidoreductase YuxK
VPTILFDANCKFCHKTVLFLKLKSDISLEIIAVGHLDSRIVLRYGLDFKKISEAMWFIDDRNNKFGGYWAFKEFFQKYSHARFLKLFFSNTLSDYFGPKIYSFVARNRHHLGCQSNNCNLK